MYTLVVSLDWYLLNCFSLILLWFIFLKFVGPSLFRDSANLFIEKYIYPRLSYENLLKVIGDLFNLGKRISFLQLPYKMTNHFSQMDSRSIGLLDWNFWLELRAFSKIIILPFDRLDEIFEIYSKDRHQNVVLVSTWLHRALVTMRLLFVYFFF